MKRPPVHEWAVLDEDKDPVPGDPDAVAVLGQSLRETADAIWREAGEIKALASVKSWQSDAADRFRDAAGDAEGTLRKAYHRYDVAAKAMGTQVREHSEADWASALEYAQQLAGKALRDAQAADADHQAATSKIKKLPAGTSPSDPTATALKKKQSDAASALGKAKTALSGAKDVRDRAAKAAAREIHRAITHDGLHDSTWDKVGHTAGDVLSDAGHFLEDVGETALSVAASIGNAMVHDPGSLAEFAGGLGLMVLGAGGEVGGGLLDATVIGAILGVPANVASAGLIALGGGIAAHAATTIGRDAAGPDRMNMSSDGSGGSSTGDWDTSAADSRTQPSKEPDPNASPRGRTTRIGEDNDEDTKRSLQRENESAETMAKAGYDVEQNPSVPGSKNPDYRIEGKIFDNYAPKTGNARNIASWIGEKVSSGQADRIVLNTSDSPVDLGKMSAQLHDWPISGLKEVTVIDKAGNIIHLYP